MATADLITSFLNNEMSPEQERGFLLTVASSDTLRLELKSHVMLDRIFVAQSERAEVPESVRGLIFAQAGVSIDGPRADDAPRSASAPDTGRWFGRSFISRFVRGGMLMLVASTGFAAGYFSHDSDAPAVQSPSATTNPAVTSPATVSSEPSTVVRESTPTNLEPVRQEPSVDAVAAERRESDRPVVSTRTEPARSSTGRLPRQTTAAAIDPAASAPAAQTPSGTAPGTAPGTVTAEPAKTTEPTSVGVEMEVKTSAQRAAEKAAREKEGRKMP